MKCFGDIDATVYNGTDNSFALVLGADGKVLNELDGITRATIAINGTVIDSDIAGGAVIWWTDQQQHRGQLVDVLKFRLGHEGLTPGEYAGSVEIYDAAAYVNGLRLENDLAVTVRA